MKTRLPIPETQLHYADRAVNDEAQTEPIPGRVDLVHYPTLGCPALLTPDRRLDILLSLPEGEDPAAVTLALIDRHGGGGVHPLTMEGDPQMLGEGPPGRQGKRRLYLRRARVDGHPHKLFDLRATLAGGRAETQANAVRIYPEITGRESVILCGDAQYHPNNRVCLERFVERMNARQDVAWIAMIGDICDNSVVNELNILRLSAFARPGSIQCYYKDEFPEAAELLSRLNKPIVLVPGNHDGMVAYENYKEGLPSGTFVGPDAENRVAYDGLHYYRRTFGPTYFSFDWGNTRYLCASSFELDRHMRLGFHAVVANWGGWMRAEQVDWLEAELKDATQRGMGSVVFIHHDPRGGSKGRELGYYHLFRDYKYTSLVDILFAYLRYLFQNAQTFQQEWMAKAGESLADHPAKRLLSLLIEHKTWGVFMGHDNHNWVESYVEGDNIFVTNPAVHHYPLAAEAEPVDGQLARDAADLLGAGEVEALAKLMEGVPEEVANASLRRAVGLLDAEGAGRPVAAFAPDAVKAWKLEAKGPIHFAHVDDVGAYKHAREAHFQAYGYVVAKLDDGRPVELQSFRMTEGPAGTPLRLDEG